MSLRLVRRTGRPHYYMHGTVRGIRLRESTGVVDAKAAEAIRARREWEIIQRSIFGPEATATFVGAAVSYLEAGGERTYLKPIIAHIGALPLAKIDQAFIERTARALYPNASPSTLNRQAFTPIAAVLNHAAKRGLCAHRIIERPPQPKGRIRWLTFEEAERLFDACASAFAPAGPVPARHWRAHVRGALSRLARARPRPCPCHVPRDQERRELAASRCTLAWWPSCGHCGIAMGPCFRTPAAAPMRKKRAVGVRSRPRFARPVGGPE